LAQSLKNEFPDLEVAGNKDGEFRVGSFEITIGGKIIFSMLKENRFPEDEEVISLLKDFL
tara:strand:- start:1089 stop:1268 length:180 start_codon:yes stop_codon:yes gene_type:complete